MKYVFVNAPMDQTVFGPFDSEHAAAEFAAKVPVAYDAWIWTQKELKDNIAAFGPINVSKPE